MSAHNLGINIKDKVIVVKENTMSGTTDNVLTRMVLIHAGNGCDPNGMGSSIFGYFMSNPTYGKELVRIEGEDIERLATSREIEIAN
jgi:hypothetical protein